MASINTIVKRKQYLWLGIVVVGTASAIGGALYLSDVDMSGNGETVAEQEPVRYMRLQPGFLLHFFCSQCTN
ncbi:conjugal transfer protein [Escherichia coli]|nr:conjugal transfer protein [Escherichia coli]